MSFSARHVSTIRSAGTKMAGKSTLGATSKEAPGTSGVRVSMMVVASIRSDQGPMLKCSRWSSRARARNLVLQLHDAVNERLGTRRAPGDIDIDRHHLIDTLDDGVVVEHTADRRTGPHRDDPLGIGHLVVDPAH